MASIENTVQVSGVPELSGIVRLRSAGASLRSRWHVLNRQISPSLNFPIAELLNLFEPIELDRIFPHHHSCELQSLRTRNFFVVHHAG